MKKNFLYAMMSAIALTGAVGFSACQSSDEIVDNPDYNPATNAVKTQFTISLPDNVAGKTRQTSDIVQSDDAGTTPEFRGLDNLLLVPYSLSSGNIVSTSTANANAINLSSFDAFEYSASKSKVYADVEIKVGTTNFLVYGKAVDKNGTTKVTSYTAADKFKFGTLTRNELQANAIPTLGDVEFLPVSISADESKTSVGTALITALNAVADAAPSENISDNTRPMFKDVTESESVDIHHFFDLFNDLTTASSYSVQTMFIKLYESMATLVTTEVQTSSPNTYKLAVAVRSKIAEYLTEDKSQLKSDLQGYPNELPDGAVRVTWNPSSKEFVSAANFNYATGLNVTGLANYVYPANLYYWVNSSLKSSSAKQSQNYSSKTSWDGTGGVLSLYDGTSVGVNTQSIAVTSPLQYGVARLNAKVNEMDSAPYYDYDGNVITVTSGYTLTGILVGNQKSVGWDFAVKGTDAYTIYDKTAYDPDGDDDNKTAWTVKPNQATSTNYTLVLQTEKGGDKSVYVALELLNNGADFKGADGIIPAGGKFYLVAELKPSAVSDYDESVFGKDRVFAQDHKTIANFTIGHGSATVPGGLGTATNGLPDLRSPEKELGLSVNLEWQSGLTFTLPIN